MRTGSVRTRDNARCHRQTFQRIAALFDFRSIRNSVTVSVSKGLVGTDDFLGAIGKAIAICVHAAITSEQHGRNVATTPIRGCLKKRATDASTPIKDRHAIKCIWAENAVKTTRDISAQTNGKIVDLQQNENLTGSGAKRCAAISARQIAISARTEVIRSGHCRVQNVGKRRFAGKTGQPLGD